MKVCVRENYIDIDVVNRIDEKTLKKQPYNFQIVDVPEEFLDCQFSDFELKRKKFVFSFEKYNNRKKVDEASQRIAYLKLKLASSDYQAIKFAEGAIDEFSFEEIRKERQSCRDEINELEKIINGGKND